MSTPDVDAFEAANWTWEEKKIALAVARANLATALKDFEEVSRERARANEEYERVNNTENE